jgi:uncharacterized protein (DUF302 family)
MHARRRNGCAVEPISGLVGSQDQVKKMARETHPARGHWKALSISYEEAFSRLPEALKKEGFGIITQIDIQETFKAKLGVDFRRYRIFGACNPSFAHAALQKDPRVGVLLPCNVVLYEKHDGKAVVGAVDPMQTLGASGESDGLADVAREVGARLERVLADLAS